MLLAGIGQIDASQRKNWFIVDDNMSSEVIESAFIEMTSRADIAIVLISQHVNQKVINLL
jgi:V-type H+-transporting ATPase subunit F